ncbi:hypothetical protein ACFXJ8_07035 [Nonomuraea sp. NPDC059194]|uniref:hypothetical protein n=1 Tax=Nonomuraea sp. NPDC059194 TaxID=3346764 RepID=UPI0036BC217C
MREAILDSTAALVAEHGLRSVTMSQIAETTGALISRESHGRHDPRRRSIGSSR